MRDRRSVDALLLAGPVALAHLTLQNLPGAALRERSDEVDGARHLDAGEPPPAVNDKVGLRGRGACPEDGESILSIQMENGLYEYRAVLEGVVVPVPDERWGRCPGGGA